jgi:hypothetical protein
MKGDRCQFGRETPWPGAGANRAADRGEAAGAVAEVVNINHSKTAEGVTTAALPSSPKPLPCTSDDIGVVSNRRGVNSSPTGRA